jgi:hypothetical protein
MGSQDPRMGEISSDGLFQWNGRDWSPLAKSHREPTPWTLPLQQAAAAYLLLDTVQSLVTTALFLNVASEERVTRAQNPAIAPDQLQAAANLGVALGWGTVIVLAVIRLVLAAGSVRGWRWTFWAVLAWLALGSVGVVTNLVALANPNAQTQPPAAIGVSLLFAVVALALLAWSIAAAVRYGPWAMRKPGP